MILQASLSFQMFHGQKNTVFRFLDSFCRYMSLFGDPLQEIILLFLLFFCKLVWKFECTHNLPNFRNSLNSGFTEVYYIQISPLSRCTRSILNFKTLCRYEGVGQ
jgi:hypothetical protein